MVNRFFVCFFWKAALFNNRLNILVVLRRPLQRMGTGMGLTAVSFVMAGFLQMKMEVCYFLTKS